MKFYLAARYGRRLEIKGYADELRALGHEVTSRWLDGEHEAFDAAPTYRQMEQWSRDDLHDIAMCDTFVAFTEPPDSPHSRGGRHVEFGFARAAGDIALIRVGPIENIFYTGVMYGCSDWRGFLAGLASDFSGGF